jgi:hypothetical protein
MTKRRSYNTKQDALDTDVHRERKPMQQFVRDRAGDKTPSHLDKIFMWISLYFTASTI